MGNALGFTKTKEPAPWVAMPPVIDNIFKYLPHQDLKNCCLVHPEWNRAAHVEVGNRNIRPKIDWCSTWSTNNLVKHGARVDHETKLGILFCNSRAAAHSSTSDVIQRNLCKDLSDFIEPCTFEDQDSASTHGFVLVTAKFIVGTTSNCNIIRSDADMDVESLSGVFLPSLAGVEYEVIPLTMLQRSLDPGFAVEDNVKCILIFTEYLGEELDILDAALIKWLQKSKLACAVGGMTVNDTHLGPVYNDYNDVMPGYAIVFKGDGVCASSVVILKEEQTFEGIRAKLVKLRLAHKLVGQTIAFVFSNDVHREFDKCEIRIFKTLFPSIPLFGTLSYYGETIGVNCFPPYDAKPCNSRGTSLFSHALVFVMLSFGA